MGRWLRCVSGVLIAVFGCTVDDAPAPPGAVRVGGDRPVEIRGPLDLEGAEPLPLLLVLHGYTATGAVMEDYLDLAAASERHRFLYATPDGTADPLGYQFWNATHACCDIFGMEIDDSTYLRRVIEDAIHYYAIDPDRIFVLGHSNGGFMAHRLACDHADLIRGIVSVAGANHLNPADCAPEQPVHVLQIHGTEDRVIKYDGGETLIDRFYPGAKDTIYQWAVRNGCDTDSHFTGTLDIESALEGEETTRTSFNVACEPGGSAELWTVVGGEHIPDISAQFIPEIIAHLLGS